MKFVMMICLMFFSTLGFASAKKLLDSNNDLFTALLGKDQEKVFLSAKKFVSTVKSEKTTELKDGLKYLEQISNKKTKDENIALYSQFMDTFFPYAKKAGLGDEYKVYYCPMIKKYWIQNGKMSEVRNVFAQYMLECGGKV
jgi:hypothetical protein